MAGTVRVAVTGAAGQVAYAMLGRLASGEVFGPDTQVILHLLEITPALPALEGVAMELDDCSFSTLKDIVITDNAEKAFDVGWFVSKEGRHGKKRTAGHKREDICWPREGACCKGRLGCTHFGGW